MVTGVSYDFHEMSISLVSESTQWWQNMAIVVIFGLVIATFLTLVVVPVLYSLLATMSERISSLTARIRKLYWKPIEWIT
jgi:predicted RND superfamily exporter protein